MAEKKKDEISFEEKIKKLESIVSELESGEVNLDDAIDKYTEAMKLSKECTEKLDDAEKRINILVQGEDGTLQEENFVAKE